MKKLILNSLFSLFIVLCFSCAQSSSGNNNSEKKGDDGSDQGSTYEVESDENNQSIIKITYPAFNAGDTYRVEYEEGIVCLAFSTSSSGQMFSLDNGKKGNTFSFTYANGMISSTFNNQTYKGYLFKDSSGNIYISDYCATRKSGSGFFCEWNNGAVSFWPKEDGSFTWSSGTSSGKGTWRNNKGIVTFFYEGDDPVILYYTSDDHLYFQPSIVKKCNPTTFEPIDDTESTTIDDDSDSDDDGIKTEAESKRDIKAVKELIDIPTVIITTESFTDFELPTGIEGYDDVVIDWSSTSDYFTYEKSFGIISEVSTSQFMKLTANITCGEYSDSKTFTVKVYPKDSTSITEADYFESAIFSFSLEKKFLNINNKHITWASIPEYMNYEQLTNIKVTLSTDNPAVDLRDSSSGGKVSWILDINRTPVRKFAKITATFTATVNRVVTTKTRIYYLDLKADEDEFYAVNNHKICGTYSFEGNNMHFTSSNSSPDAIYKYEFPRAKDLIKLSVIKKYINGKWYTKAEWLKEFGNTETLKRQAEYEFFTNKTFNYSVGSAQVFPDANQSYTYNDSSFVTALSLTSQWDSSVSWTLQYGSLVEEDSGSAFILPVKNNSFSRWRNSYAASFEPLKQMEGYFNSDYSTFTALGTTYSVKQYELSGKYYIDFISDTETYTFHYASCELREAEW